ncbi:MAG TPA: serine/threonine-protein kinase [Bdellovibrionales bacterium]|nr:serine/threonine-protein kinase [Bdellovibrionales bacterium]
MSLKPEFFGKYILLEKIAVGGMAEVYLAKVTGAENIAKFVAVKRILPQHSRNQDFIEMFKEEAKICVNLSHGNIVPIFEFGEDRGQFYLAMEYVEGRNLRQIVNRMKEQKRHLTIDQCLYIINESARGLDHAHRCIDGSTGRPLNIIHRDISPQNIMVSFEGGVKIVDFGIAKAESKVDSTRLGTLKGKFSYMSPEQAEGQEVDFRTDIFSLGIVLWELLANERLFSANNEMNTLRKIRECQIPSLHKIDPNIPPELEKICTKALARDRNLRYQSASEFHRDLNRFLNRQYPDFSTQDFSSSMKQLFAEEILETRRRLVEYAKISANGTPSEEPTSTIAVDVTKTITDTATETGKVESSAPTNDVNLSLGGTGPKLETVSKTPAPVQNKTKLAIVPAPKPSLQPILRAEPQEPARAPQPLRLDRSTPKPPAPEVVDESDGGSFGFVGFLSLLVILAVAWTMRNDPMFDSIRCRVLQQNCKGEGTSTGENGTGGKTLPTPEPAKIELVVMSQPQGAEIFIDNKPTGQFTPSTIRVAPQGETSIALRKEGYLAHSQKLVAPKQADSINVTLVRADVGYLNITVRPLNAVIYVNEVELQEKPPINRYPVPARKRIVVRAFDTITGAQAEKSVTVKPDTTQDINLFLSTNRK